jgi:hypothetical protein
MNPVTGRAMCAPKLADVSPADGNQVTCYRCQHLMQINRTLRGNDFAVGGAQVLVDAAARARMK